MEIEFDGSSEKEAVQNAINELNVKDFEYEVISETKKSLFKKPSVRIRVFLKDDSQEKSKKEEIEEEEESMIPAESIEPQNDIEKDIVDFICGLAKCMDIQITPEIVARGNRGKLLINLESEDTAHVIGYKGERLDALQIIVSSFVLRKYPDFTSRIVLDVDNYRETRTQKILNDSLYQAKKVKSSGKPIFLEPLNSYERRIVHKAISELGGLATESYGNGLLKKIKIFRV